MHADAYIDFLRGETDRLKTEYARGRTAPTVSLLLYRVIQKKQKGHGHVVVYEVIGGAVVRVIRYFHTAQDWHIRLARELDV